MEMEEYNVPDEHLSYSELKDRIRGEVARTLPKKERIILMAKKLEDDLTLKDTICDQICCDFKDLIAEQYIRRCLPDEYKQHRRRLPKETSDELRTKFVNDNKNIPEQTAMTVDTQGYDESFGAKRPNVESAAETVKQLQKEIDDVRRERDSLSIENNVLKEKSQPEMLQEVQQRFYDEPGLIKGDKLQKVNEEAGKNLAKMLERYNSILNDAAVCGQAVPVGLYVIAKPEMVFVPVRFTVNFKLRRLDISLWEKKLQNLNI
jgi:FtsZ-binding cell division protein ZapB